MQLKEIIKSIDQKVILPRESVDFEVKGISGNSKSVQDGFIFAAIKGACVNGNEFIKEAVLNGAQAVIVQYPAQSRTRGVLSYIQVKDARSALAKLAAQFYAHPSSKIKVTGITGTNGKTTISYLIEAILHCAHRTPAVVGTINYRFKNKVFDAKNTTPGPVEIQSLLHAMQEEGVTDAVMEVSSHALDQERTEGIAFHAAIFTNLTQDHLDYHKTKENYFLAKSKLFKHMNPRSFAIINNDDPYGSRLKRVTHSRVMTYGIDKKSQVSAHDIVMDMDHTEFLLSSPCGSTTVSTALIGRHNVYNILAAAAWACGEGIGLEVVKAAVKQCSIVPGRLERVPSHKGFHIFVDYAHTEDALKNVIESLRKICGHKIIVVFGCGGERDKTKRPKMGRVVTQLADYAVITNDNPRGEDPRAILQDIKKGIKNTNFRVIPDRFKAIQYALAQAARGDVVVVAGKGHENYQILNKKRVHFDDREAIKECLRSMS